MMLDRTPDPSDVFFIWFCLIVRLVEESIGRAVHFVGNAALVAQSGSIGGARATGSQAFSCLTTVTLGIADIAVKAFRPLSTVEQLAGHLREEVLRGSLGGSMPGVNQLARSLGVSPKTVIAAMKQLEREGMLQGQGPRRRSRIVLPTGAAEGRRLRVAILDYEAPALTEIELQHLLEGAGHTAFFAGKSLQELGMDVRRVARLVAKTGPDAWVVCAGSGEVLEWFAAQPVPAFALFGRRRNVPLAGVGPNHLPACLAAVRRLLEHGHQRIVMLVRRERREGGPGDIERAILDKMAAHGIGTGPYNLPDWENSREGFQQVLDQLYRVTPPSALILDEACLFPALRSGNRLFQRPSPRPPPQTRHRRPGVALGPFRDPAGDGVGSTPASGEKGRVLVLDAAGKLD